MQIDSVAQGLCHRHKIAPRGIVGAAGFSDDFQALGGFQVQQDGFTVTAVNVIDQRRHFRPVFSQHAIIPMMDLVPEFAQLIELIDDLDTKPVYVFNVFQTFSHSITRQRIV
ncbi:hypothetical protein D3C81_1296220 [compost metagenome]